MYREPEPEKWEPLILELIDPGKNRIDTWNRTGLDHIIYAHSKDIVMVFSIALACM